MKPTLFSIAVMAVAVVAVPGAAIAQTVGTAFTYQGRLAEDGAAVDGVCDFQFGLFDANTNGTQVGTTQTANSNAVINGLFTVTVDFGEDRFIGAARWLEVSVQCPGDGAPTTLSPRQPVTPAPYALALPGLWTEQNTTSPNLVGGYSGNVVPSGVVGATIGGGGHLGFGNEVLAAFGTVGGGQDNTAGFVETRTCTRSFQAPPSDVAPG